MFFLEGEGSFLKSERKLINAGAYSETSQTSKMKLFAEIVNVLKSVNYFRKKLLRSLFEKGVINRWNK